MEDIFHWCREGNAFQVRVWLDDTTHDMNQGDDHGFSPLHWAAKEGRTLIVEMLINKGARVNATNMGDDTALHLASAHGHKDICQLLIKCRPDVNAINEHGNTPLHYACFWGYLPVAELLVQNGAQLHICNKYGDTPLDKCKGDMVERLTQLAQQTGQDLNKRIPFKDQSWLGTKTRSRDATLSRHSGIPMEDLVLQDKIASTPSGDTWRGLWQNNKIAAKFINIGLPNPTPDQIRRASRAFADEFPKLRIFSHPNILPVIGCTNSPPNLIVVSQWMPYGSLYHVLHEQSGIVVDQTQALKFAYDIARGMAFLHTLDLDVIERLFLNSKHIYIDEDLVARINMADTKFSFQEKNKFYQPAWMSPEALQKKQSEINRKASDMWSFAVLLWEIFTRQVPFAEFSPMEIGMKIALEDLRLTVPPGISTHIARIIKICMNEDPGKRPSFEDIAQLIQKILDLQS